MGSKKGATGISRTPLLEHPLKKRGKKRGKVLEEMGGDLFKTLISLAITTGRE